MYTIGKLSLLYTQAGKSFISTKKQRLVGGGNGQPGWPAGVVMINLANL
jgi:hypothetical protein